MKCYQKNTTTINRLAVQFLRDLKLVLPLLLSICIISCKKLDNADIINLNGNRIGIIGHGGLGFPSPENRLPINSNGSILQAVEGWQADGVEVDVRMSADSLLILYHDDYLSSLTDCNGCIGQHSGASLLKCRYRQSFNTNIAQDEQLITLESILERFAQRRIRPLVHLDVKLSFPCAQSAEIAILQQRMARQISNLITRYDATTWTVIETSNLTFAEQLIQENPNMRLIFAGIPGVEAIELAKDRDFFGLIFLHRDSNKDLVMAAHEAGLQVVLWGVIIRKDVLNAVEQSPDWVITDNIPLTIEFLK